MSSLIKLINKILTIMEFMYEWYKTNIKCPKFVWTLKYIHTVTYKTVYRISTDINHANEPVYQQHRSLFDIIVVWDFLELGVSITILSWRVESYKHCTHLKKYFQYTSSIIILCIYVPNPSQCFLSEEIPLSICATTTLFIIVFPSNFSAKMLSCNS